MIKTIKGIILDKDNSGITIFLEPLSLYCLVPRSHEYIVGNVVELKTELIWNSETGPNLYGFQDIDEKKMFLLLIGCSGIGPKYALNILSNLSIVVLVDAIKQENAKLLSQTPGIGTKKAELIIVELKNKIQNFLISHGTEKNKNQEKITEVLEALKHLGYKPNEIYKATTLMTEDINLQTLEIQHLIKEVIIKINN